MYYRRIKSKKIYKLLFLIAILLVVLLCYFYEKSKYNNLINEFKSNFDEYKFSTANNLLLTTEKFNPFKLYLLNSDISTYFNDKITTLSTNITNKKISSENALLQLKEIQHYNIIPDDEIQTVSSSISLIQDSIKNYNDAVNFYNDGEYEKAISCLKNVSALDLNYPEALIYLNKSQSALKDNLFTYCDALTDNDHYTEALSKIYDKSNLLSDDEDVEEKITDIKTKQQNYFDKNTAIVEASSHAFTATISPSNINKLNIESSTTYFINVDIKNQKTYIYKGKADNWQLIRTCPCSTGISGDDTPSGSFSIKEKGDWFYSDKYEQGGKYWTQITGDILFHSIPFAKDRTTIVDYTLNKPSSHGCVRLSIDDAKWIYNNITKGSKVIIK